MPRPAADPFDLLVCPLCADGLRQDGNALRCGRRHAFDVARQGYVNLLPGDARPGTADTPEMVRARAGFLAAGHYAPLTGHLAAAVPPDAHTLLEAGAGTGHHLAAVLADRPGAVGLALDLSKHALRRAARAHPRLRAAVWDVWRPLPLRDACTDVVLNVFAPRNAAEFHRVLRPGGTLVVVTPAADHLAELRAAGLGMLDVDADKPERLDRALGERFAPDGSAPLAYRMALTPAEAADAIGMGPAARHAAPGARDALATLEELAAGGTIAVTASFRRTAYRPV